jgi:VIT1/CCC1 family predicted Fe2+/Mn2+ transporter
MVYGGLDGLVSAFAVVNAGESAYYGPAEIVGIGLASMLVEGFSMGLGDYLSSKAEIEFIKE